MRFYTLTTNERAECGYTHAFEVTADDLTQTSTATAQTLTTPLVCGVGDFIVQAGHVLKIPFKDASDSAFNDDTMSVGDSVGGVATVYAALQMNENGTEILNKSVLVTGTPRSGFTAATTITITFNSMTAKALVNIDVGVLVVFVQLFRPSKLSSALSAGPILTK